MVLFVCRMELGKMVRVCFDERRGGGTSLGRRRVHSLLVVKVNP